MKHKNNLKLHQSLNHSSLPGPQTLAPGRAISLRPRYAGALQLSQGRVWVTFDAPHGAHGLTTGDHFLQAGQALAVCAGQRLVMETWGPAPVCFEWLATRTVPVGSALQRFCALGKSARQLWASVLAALPPAPRAIALKAD